VKVMLEWIILGCQQKIMAKMETFWIAGQICWLRIDLFYPFYEYKISNKPRVTIALFYI